MARTTKPTTNGRKTKARRGAEEALIAERRPASDARRGRKPKRAPEDVELFASVADELLPGTDPNQHGAGSAGQEPSTARRGRKPKQRRPAPESAVAAPVAAAAFSAEPRHEKSAVHWDRATDTVTFDWPGIEQTAAQEGPNQAMAKLLVAARAEGANSRWPF